MRILESLKSRRTHYDINRELPVDEARIFDLIEKATELVPDAFNMKSSRVVVATGEKQDQLWDTIYDVFEGKVAREKIDSFKNGYGTILYFYDQAVVKGMQDQFSLYADKFPEWASQASAMLQISIWSGLKELGAGASLQHYNEVIEEKVIENWDIPKGWKLIAQMPFGKPVANPNDKEFMPLKERVKTLY